LVSVFFLFGESHYVVRGAQEEYHELVTFVVVPEGVIVRAKIFPLHVLLVDVRQAQQFNHLGCVYNFHANFLAIMCVVFVAWTVSVHVYACAT